MTDAPKARRTLLVVDDEAEITVALTDLFEDRYRVRATTSPREALDWLREDPSIAVIVSDQRMPDMPGNVFLAEARKISDAESILLTGYADLSAVASAVNQGAISGYVHKPWEPEALVAMVDAAAERVALRDALTFERGVYRALVNGSADAVSVLDAGLGTLRGNAAHERLSEARSSDASADRAALADGYSDSEREWVDAGGDHRWTRTQRIPFEGERGERYLLRIESDETDRRLAERKLYQGEKLQALGTLAGGIAHDFNNLLAIVVGNLDLAKRSLDNPERLGTLLERALDAASRGTAVSRRLLSFSRQRDIAVESFDAGENIAGLADLLDQAMDGRSTIELELEDGLWSVRADPGQFELALVNLCINARDAMPDGGIVRIQAVNVPNDRARADFKGDHVRISVIDQGSGMTPELQERVFEPFFTTKPHGVGTGLGLPIVRSMAQAAGGDVRIESEEGRGSTISLWLPRSEDAHRDRPTSAPAQPVRDLRVLLVEDDPALCTTISAQLREMGHDVVAFGAAEAALDQSAQADFDVLITDFALPGMNGAELITRLTEQRPGLPTLLITAYAEYAESASYPVLTKPFASNDLQEMLARIIHDAG